MYGKRNVFDADRLIDLLNAFETFTLAAAGSRGDMDLQVMDDVAIDATDGAASLCISMLLTAYNVITHTM